jgi:integrase/recombinase XerD
VRRIAVWFDGGPNRLEAEQLAEYFSELVESHSWSTVKLDRCGLQFFYQHVLKHDWQCVHMIKPQKIRSLPNILSVREIDRLIGAARNELCVLLCWLVNKPTAVLVPKKHIVPAKSASG